MDLIKSFFRDRSMTGLVAVLLVGLVSYVIYVALALEPSDLQVATRYTAFGDTHFYRNKWYYLLSFMAFGAIMIGLHVSLAIKLYGREQIQLAKAILGMTVFLLIICWIITRSVLQIAFL